jgi:hypothetical protein
MGQDERESRPEGDPANALCLVEHSMSYPNPTELHDRISTLATAAGRP